MRARVARCWSLGLLVLACLSANAGAATMASAPEPASAEAAPAEPAPAEPAPAPARGVASWYGRAFHGRPTASGELFDMHAFTAAHPTLPFGTLVEVRSLVNGRKVQVRINDRGPYKGKRMIDLSRAAAAKIGLLGRGLKRVELRVVADAAAAEPPAASPHPRPLP